MLIKNLSISMFTHRQQRLKDRLVWVYQILMRNKFQKKADQQCELYIDEWICSVAYRYQTSTHLHELELRRFLTDSQSKQSAIVTQKHFTHNLLPDDPPIMFDGSDTEVDFVVRDPILICAL